MIRTVPQIAQMALGAAWRRRYLICIPSLVMPILAGVVHVVVPKSFEARMTILVQEPGA